MVNAHPWANYPGIFITEAQISFKRTVLENSVKPRNLGSISKAEFYLSLKQIAKASFYFDFQEDSPAAPHLSEGKVVCTRLHLEFSLASVGSVLILIPLFNAFYSFCFGMQFGGRAV